MQAHCLINIPRNYGSQDEPGCFGSCVPGYDSRPRSDWIRRIADNVDKGVCNRLLGRVLDGHGGEKIVAQYEQSLLWARTGASVIGFLYKLAKNLTFWSLTWATVVILGAYVDNLHPGDYYYIILILLIEGTRLPLAAFFTQLLIYYDIPPGHILSQHQLSYLTQLSTNFSIPLRLLSALLQVLFITPNIVLSFIRLVHMHVHTYPTKQPTQYYVHSSLVIFYILVMVNAMVCFSMAVLTFVVWFRFQHLKLQPTGKAEKSLLKYFDQVLYHATAEGVLNEASFNFMEFAIVFLGREYANKLSRWNHVTENHEGLLKYLHADQRAADYVLVSLASGDMEVQQGAANIVGAWAYLKLGDNYQVLQQLPVELLTKMADMVGTGEIGRAAVQSFSVLARIDPRYISETSTSNNELVLDQIVKLVNSHKNVYPIPAMRALIFFYDKLRESESRSPTANKAMASSWKLSNESLEEKLAEELKKLLHLDIYPNQSHFKIGFTETYIQRVRLHAAYLLHMLGLEHKVYHFQAQLRDIIPREDGREQLEGEWWFSHEIQMLNYLREAVLSLPPVRTPPQVESLKFKLSPPALAAKPTLPHARQ